MTDTETDTLPNGTGGLSTEDEDERLRQRPADIDADVREMERRKRVEALMSSKMFREELERVLDQQLHEGVDAPLLQRIREMVGGKLHTGSMRGPSCVLPINDIRGIEGYGYEKGEKILRCKLAAVYRLVDLFGWSQGGVSGQITARLNTAEESVLTTPRGLLPHEVTASSLVKVDMQGTVQEQGTTNFPINAAGFSLHAAVHAARPDLRCVLHVRSPSALALSATRGGLLPLCTEAALLGLLAYHHVPYGTLDNEERDKLVRALGPTAKVLMLSNAGALCCGETLEEAFHQAKNLTTACDVQLRLAALPMESLSLIDEDTRKQIYEASRKPPADGVKWRIGGEEFEALMRMLDNAGFRTGYIYRHPLVKNDVPKPKNDVEVPPAVSSLGYLLEEEELYKQGLWKKGQGKGGERTRWLNSPNVYQKVEVLETGTNDPKKITKWVEPNNDEWVQDSNVTMSSTPVKIESALQFVPKNTNPKEFKQLQQQIKENRRADKISAGPQSHILEGVTWDEAARLIAAEDAHATHTGDHVVLMGAASKGIIQRGYQHNATVYSAPYARNPFDHVTDREIDEYKKTVERKQRGEYDTDVSESEAVSGAQITSPASAVSETEDDSRNEHRVLRIETTQAPIRSQPEVVLSDDPSDFLNAERAHADLTRDRNLLSDDEVFLNSGESAVNDSSTTVAVATSTATATATTTASVVTTERNPPVVVRQFAVTHRTVVGGGTALTSGETVNNVERSAMSNANSARKTATTIGSITNGRTNNNYPRSPNFDNVLKFYESKERTSSTTDPKFRLSLDFRSSEIVTRDLSNSGNLSSRSSLYSVPSIEWDAKLKSDFQVRTRSLPRSYKFGGKNHNIYRTRSHSGFINSYIGEPKPRHFHAPKYGYGRAEWMPKGRFEGGKVPAMSSLYFSVDNIYQKCMEESFSTATSNFDIVKVKETLIPVYNVTRKGGSDEDEFVESQEFTEDCYIEGFVNNSFSSGNQTVVKKSDRVSNESNPYELVTAQKVAVETLNETIEYCANIYSDVTATMHDISVNLYKSTCLVDDVENEVKDHFPEDTVHGEYLNFSGEFDIEAVYENPVKELINKDIRDYSVPIKYYCDDFGKNQKPPSYRVQQKRLEPITNTNCLEPILEESKSSYTDESNSTNSLDAVDKNSKTNDNNISVDVLNASKRNAALNSGATAIDTHDEVLCKNIQHKEKSNTNESANALKSVNNDVSENVEEPDMKEFKDIDIKLNEKKCQVPSEVIGNENVSKKSYVIPATITRSSVHLDNKRKSDGSSTTLSSIGSFDSTSEFELVEVISDIVGKLVDRTCLENRNDDDELIIAHDVNRIVDEQFSENKVLGCDEKENVFDYDQSVSQFVKPGDDKTVDLSRFIGNICKYYSEGNSIEMEGELKVENAYDFCMAELIEKIEDQSPFDYFNKSESNDTNSEILNTTSIVVVEVILRYIIDQVYFICGDKQKNNEKKTKKVITVSECEDILFTAKSIWDHDYSVDCQIHVIDEVNENRKLDITIENVNSQLNSSVSNDEDVLECVNISHKVGEMIEILEKNPCETKLETDNIVIFEHERNPEVISEIDTVHLELEVDGYIDSQDDCNVHAIVEYTRNEKDVDVTAEMNLVPPISGYDYTTERDDSDPKMDYIIHDEDVEMASPKLDMDSDNKLSLSRAPSYERLRKADFHEYDLENWKNFSFDKVPLNVNQTYQTEQTNVETLLCKCDFRLDLLEKPFSEKHTLDIQIYAKSDIFKSVSLGESNRFKSVFPEQMTSNIEVDVLEKSFTEKCQTPVEISLEEVNYIRKLNTDRDRELERISIEYATDLGVTKSKQFEKEERLTDVSMEKGSLEVTRTIEDSTFANELNVAFVEDKSLLGNSQSSPVKDDSCSKLSYDSISPIRSPGVSNDLSDLYEKDDNILNSPFVKIAPVISMSQTVQRGGIKYWLSFDEDLNDFKKIGTLQESRRRSRRFEDAKIPSFFSIDRPKNCKNCNFKPDCNPDDFADYQPRVLTRRDTMLCEELPDRPDLDETTYLTASVSTKDDSYDTCRRSFADDCTVLHTEGEHTVNGDQSDAHQSTFSHSSKEGSPSKEVSLEDSPKKDKKKKKGLRTPSFLKKKKEKKKSTTPQPA